jgi:hypothetical protein
MFCVMCGAANLDIGRFCKVCGKPLVKDSDMSRSSLLDYPNAEAVPEPAESGQAQRGDGNKLVVPTDLPLVSEAAQKPAEGTQSQIFRDGNKLVVPKGASLPLYCVKCGSTEATMVDKSFRWMNPWYYLLLLLGFGILLIVLVYLIFGKKVKLSIPLCGSHRQYMRRLKIAAMVLLVGCIPVGVLFSQLIGEPDGDGWGILIGILMVLGGLIAVHLQSPLQATRIDDDRATMKGACEAFLSRLNT